MSNTVSKPQVVSQLKNLTIKSQIIQFNKTTQNIITINTSPTAVQNNQLKLLTSGMQKPKLYWRPSRLSLRLRPLQPKPPAALKGPRSPSSQIRSAYVINIS